MTAWRLLGLSVALTAALVPGAAGAQEPADTAAPPASPTDAAGDTLPSGAPADSLGTDTIAAAVRPPRPVPRLLFALSGGLARFTDLQTQAADLASWSAGGEPVSTTVRRSIGVEAGRAIGISAIFNTTPRWGVRVGVTMATGSLKAEFAADDTASANRAARLPVAGERAVRITTWEAALQYRIPSAGRLRPYVELGAAALNWGIDAGPGTVFPGAGDLVQSRMRAAVQAAVGAMVPLSDRAAARVQATTQLFRTPLGTAPAGGLLAAGDSSSLAFGIPRSAHYADAAVELVRAVRLEVGLTYGLGRVPTAPPPESAPAATSSPTPR